MIRNTAAITISSFLCMFFIGVGTAIIGAAARNIGLTPYQIGLLLSIQNLGFMVSLIISGTLADAYEKPMILFIGSTVLSLSFFTFYLSASFFVNALIMLFIGVGIGTYEGVTDPMLLDIHTRRQSLYINVNHFFVTSGALMITLYLVFMQMDWRKSVTQSGAVTAALAVFFLLTRIDRGEKAIGRLSDRVRLLWRERVVTVLFFVVLCIVGVELGSIGIMTTFLMELRGFSQVTSKIGLLVFIGGIATGRLLIGFFTKKDHIVNSVSILLASSTLFLSCLFFVNAKGLTFVIVFLTGVSMSATFPLIVTLSGLMYKEISGTVLGFVKLAIPIGGILIPLALSIATKYMSFSMSLLIFPISSFIGFLILFLSRNKLRARPL